MPHEIDRVLAFVAGTTWAIDPAKASEIMAFLAMRAEGHGQTWSGDQAQPIYAGPPVAARGGGHVRLLRLHGTVVPRAGMMSAMSGASSMEGFQAAFRDAAADPEARAIVIDVDSPGGAVDLVPEVARAIRAARSADRPIVAVANTMAASAAYWLASAADEIVVTPSGTVGSIGVMTQRENLRKALAMRGIEREVFSWGPRKAEGHPFGPGLDDAARAAIEAEGRAMYSMFTSDVAKWRGVPVETVRADPEDSAAHFGGGRAYRAARAVSLGMADRIATLDETLARLARGRPTRTGLARKRLAML